VWLAEAPLDPGKSYFIKHTTQTSRVNVEKIHAKKDLDTLADVPAETLALNEIGRATLTAHRALFVDGYADNRETGSFILIDSITNATVAAGMIVADEAGQDLERALEDARRGETAGSRSQVSTRERRQRFGVAGGIVVLVTPPGSPASPLAHAVERVLFDRGGSTVLVSAEDGGRWLTTARAVADAGLLAVVTVEAGALGELRTRLAEDDERALIVELAGRSPEDGAKAAIAAIAKRGWLGAP
jgi:bifunctional enzyme CysN/CysC